MNKNYIIIHGSFGSPFGNWFEWLNNEIQNAGNRVEVPQFPIGVEYQNYENWSKLLKYYLDLGLINENTVLVGHSLAPVFISKFLIENKIKVSKLIFVSGFNNYLVGDKDFDTVNKSFFIDNLEDIHMYCDDISCIYSDNDQYLPFEILEDFANKVSDTKEIIKCGGHLNSESGYNEFKEILKYI